MSELTEQILTLLLVFWLIRQMRFMRGATQAYILGFFTAHALLPFADIRWHDFFVIALCGIRMIELHTQATQCMAEFVKELKVSLKPPSNS
jgi:hypothetical protein